MACAGWISATLAMSSVMNFMSVMAASTTWARFSAPSGLRVGASRDGERTRAAFRGPAGVGVGPEPRRRANAARQRGGIRHGELGRRLGEIALRRRLDA